MQNKVQENSFDDHRSGYDDVDTVKVCESPRPNNLMGLP